MHCPFLLLQAATVAPALLATPNASATAAPKAARKTGAALGFENQSASPLLDSDEQCTRSALCAFTAWDLAAIHSMNSVELWLLTVLPCMQLTSRFWCLVEQTGRKCCRLRRLPDRHRKRIEKYSQGYPGTPVFLVGESMGGAIAMRAASRYPALVDGLISSVPSSERYGGLTSKMHVGFRYLENKDKPMDVGTTVVEHATSNTALQKRMLADKSNRMELSPKELKQFNDFMKGNFDAAALIEKKCRSYFWLVSKISWLNRKAQLSCSTGYQLMTSC